MDFESRLGPLLCNPFVECLLLIFPSTVGLFLFSVSNQCLLFEMFPILFRWHLVIQFPHTTGDVPRFHRRKTQNLSEGLHDETPNLLALTCSEKLVSSVISMNAMYSISMGDSQLVSSIFTICFPIIWGGHLQRKVETQGTRSIAALGRPIPWRHGHWSPTLAQAVSLDAQQRRRVHT